MDVFSATVTNSSWRNLKFFKKILEFFRKFLELIQKNGKNSKNCLNFPNFKLCLVEKLKYGQIFVHNISTSGHFMSKKSVLSWQIIEFLIDLLEFFENLLEFFFSLSFFSKCQKSLAICIS